MNINEQEINEITEQRKMTAQYDFLLQKYLRDQTVQEERDQLLMISLKHLNNALQREQIYRKTIARMTKGENITVVIDERFGR